MLDLMNLMQSVSQEEDHISPLEPGAPEPIEAPQKDSSIEAKIGSLLAAKTKHEVKAIQADAEVVQRLAAQRLQEFDLQEKEGAHNLEHTLEGEKHVAEHVPAAQDTLG